MNGHMLIDSAVRITFGAIGTTANSVQMFCIVKKKEAKRPFDATLLSLSIADLVTSATLLFFGIYDLLSTYRVVSETEFLNSVNEAALDLSIITSLVHVMFIAIQRLCAVLCPINFRLLFTTFRCKLGLTFIWIVAAVYCIWSSMEKAKGTPTFFILSITIIVCIALLLFSYSVICCKVVKSRSFARSRRSAEPAVLYNSLMVASAFVICTIPFTLQQLGAFEPISFYQFIIPTWCLFFNVVLDPFIYFLFKRIKASKTTWFPCSKRMSNSRTAVENQLISRCSSKQATKQTITEL